jgi:hypothetical protein
MGWLGKLAVYGFGSRFLKPKHKSQGTHKSLSNEEFNDDDTGCNDDVASRNNDGSCVDSMDETQDDIGSFNQSEWTLLRPISPRNMIFVQ